MHTAHELVCRIDTLASLPSVYTRIRELAKAPESSLADVCEVVASDPAITAKLLKVVNSAIYGFGGKIDSLHHAVRLLGLQQVHDLVLAISLGSFAAVLNPGHMDMRRFWRESVMRGVAAREIARRGGQPCADRLLIFGLLADIGHLVMYQTVPQLADEARYLSESTGRPLAQCELDIVGCDFAQVGAALCEHWQLPGSFSQIIGGHLAPRLGTEFGVAAAITLVSVCVVEAERQNLASEEAAARIAPVIWQALGLEAQAFGEVREVVRAQLAAYLQTLFVGLRTD